MEKHACAAAAPLSEIQNSENLNCRNQNQENYRTPTAEGDAEILRKMLRFRAWHRGTREMDLLIGSFADLYLAQFSEADLLIFQEILTHQDPDVYDWVIGRATPPVELNSRVMELLCKHRFAGLCS